MKYAIAICTLCLATFTATAQSASEQRNVSDFDAIQVQDGIEVKATQSGKETLTLKATKASTLAAIVTTVENNTLIIKRKEGKPFAFSNGTVTAVLNFKHIKAVRLSGGSEMEVAGAWKENNVAATLSGGAEIEADISVENLALEMSGGSQVDLDGNAQNLALAASGGSKFDACDLISQNCTVNTSGGSSACVVSNDALTVNASGGSTVRYGGNPSNKNINASGAASVRTIK
ncbi:MAG: DUF2807 domain-containing protein [Saprospiraceae bacterium]|nr:DUF2807 domain-containing protein [Saprospiraceae bacterium]MBP7680051.1 DUF2807 domain-containing protein [Saprospiraceae bacterium]